MAEKRPSKSPSLKAFALRLENYRGYEDSTELRLAPLTCLVGTNSSGKSSVISSLLLLKQSFEQKAVSSRVSPLTLSGPYCELGEFEDVVNGHDRNRQIGFTFKIPLKALDPGPTYPRSIVELSIPYSQFATRAGHYWSYRIREVKLPSKGYVTVRMEFSADEPFGPSLSRINVDVEGIGSVSCTRTISGERRQHWRIYVADLPPQCIRPAFYPNYFFPVLRPRENKVFRTNPEVKQKVDTFLKCVESVFEFIMGTIRDSELIGPFRTPPERRYQFGGFSTSRGGPSGETTVDLLITEKLLKTPNAPLRTEVEFWLRHLGLAKTVSVDDLAKNIKLFEVNLGGVSSRSNINVADVGFGISQILPVLTQGLLTKRGGIYMVQQPEIHLHPDAQAALADFFLYLISNGVRVIVETHSEYLLIRLRRRLAEGKVSIAGRGTGIVGAGINIPVRIRDVSVLLTTPTRRNGIVATELVIGKGFQFENLPRDFMSQAIEDRLALLKAVGRKK